MLRSRILYSVVTMSTYRTKTVDGNLVLQRVTVKGSKKHYLAKVTGPGKEDFPLELGFLGEEEYASPVVFEKVGGKNAAVESFNISADDMFQTALKGDRATFFTVNSKGLIINMDRREVHEAVGANWEER